VRAVLDAQAVADHRAQGLLQQGHVQAVGAEHGGAGEQHVAALVHLVLVDALLQVATISGTGWRNPCASMACSRTRRGIGKLRSSFSNQP
jgi:hypothetical protein